MKSIVFMIVVGLAGSVFAEQHQFNSAPEVVVSQAIVSCEAGSCGQQQFRYGGGGVPIIRWFRGNGWHPFANGVERRQSRRASRGGLFGGRFRGC